MSYNGNEEKTNMTNDNLKIRKIKKILWLSIISVVVLTTITIVLLNTTGIINPGL